MHEQVEVAKADLRSRCEERFDAVAGWAKLEVGKAEVEPEIFDTPKPERPKVKRFFGETYLRIAGGSVAIKDRTWLKKEGRRRP